MALDDRKGETSGRPIVRSLLSYATRSWSQDQSSQHSHQEEECRNRLDWQDHRARGDKKDIDYDTRETVDSKRKKTIGKASCGRCTASDRRVGREKIIDAKTQRSRSECQVPARQAGVENVFVKDEKFCWLPAKVLEHRKDHAIVTINLPKTWESSTICADRIESGGESHLSVKKLDVSELDRLTSEYRVPKCMLRKEAYSEYEWGELPKQNTQGGRSIELDFLEGRISSDLADLTELHMPAILYNLKERYYIQKPYTRVGDILIAMNPFVWIDDLYTVENREVYSQNLIWNYSENEDVHGSYRNGKPTNAYDRLGFDPHVYEISSLAYRELGVTGQDQTIIVTGESGAGKTETVKILIDHLASVQFSRPGQTEKRSNSSKDIVTKVIQSSPVFEAFGNARTARNDNSSRFGKSIQLQFKTKSNTFPTNPVNDVPQTNLIGSEVSTYLLEKNRVVFHNSGERTFHIFYQLLAAPTDFKNDLWPFFTEASVYDFMYTAGSVDNQSAKEFESWIRTEQALKIFNVKDDVLLVLMRGLAIVLQLGNITFEFDTSSAYEQSTIISNKHQLERLSEMMGIQSEYLEAAMTSRTLKAPNVEPIKVCLTPDASKEVCDALAKEIYAMLFDFVVGRVNEYSVFEDGSLNSSSTGRITLLDIFGFENFATNKFEQLCINYCNEKIQRKYVLDNFNEIKEQYMEEGVDLYDFELIDNSEILHLLESRHGLIQMLNEECLRPKGRDSSFVYKVKKMHLGPRSKLISEKLHSNTEFGVRHFAGCVRYDANNFVHNNMDKLPHDVIQCAAKSTNSIIKNQFRRLLESEVNGNGRRRKNEVNRTVLNKFQGQLKNLMAVMEGTKTRYVRCIKPNQSMVPKMTDHKSVMRQMECSGLKTALVMSQESYPQNLDYDFILTRYSCLLRDDNIAGALAGLSVRERVSYVLTRWLTSMSKKNRDGSRTLPFACGKTKVFFKAGAQEELEYLRRQYFESSARLIQSLFRMKSARLLRYRMYRAVNQIQTFGRMGLAKIRFRRKRSSATTIAALIRRYFAVRAFRRRQESVTLIQNSYRQWNERRIFVTTRHHILLIQSVMRMALTRLHLQKQKTAAATIGAWIRSCCLVESQKQLRSSRSRGLYGEEVREAPSETKCDARISSPSIQSVRRESIISDERAFKDLQTVGTQTQEVDFGISSAEARAEQEALIDQLRSRILALTKTNNSLTKEVFKVRHEKETLCGKHRSLVVQMSSKISVLEEEMKLTHRNHQKERERRKRKAEQSVARLKERHEFDVKKLRDELEKTRESHRVYLVKLMDVLETTHNMREEETAQLTRELVAIKKKQDNQILTLRKEVKALRINKAKANSWESLPFLDAPRIHKAPLRGGAE